MKTSEKFKNQPILRNTPSILDAAVLDYEKHFKKSAVVTRDFNLFEISVGTTEVSISSGSGFHSTNLYLTFDHRSDADNFIKASSGRNEKNVKFRAKDTIKKYNVRQICQMIEKAGGSLENTEKALYALRGMLVGKELSIIS